MHSNGEQMTAKTRPRIFYNPRKEVCLRRWWIFSSIFAKCFQDKVHSLVTRLPLRRRHMSWVPLQMCLNLFKNAQCSRSPGGPEQVSGVEINTKDIFCCAMFVKSEQSRNRPQVGADSLEYSLLLNGASGPEPRLIVFTFWSSLVPYISCFVCSQEIDGKKYDTLFSQINQRIK